MPAWLDANTIGASRRRSTVGDAVGELLVGYGCSQCSGGSVVVVGSYRDSSNSATGNSSESAATNMGFIGSPPMHHAIAWPKFPEPGTIKP